MYVSECMDEIKCLGSHELAVFVFRGNVVRPQSHDGVGGGGIERGEVDASAKRLARCQAAFAGKEIDQLRLIRPQIRKVDESHQVADVMCGPGRNDSESEDGENCQNNSHD